MSKCEECYYWLEDRGTAPGYFRCTNQSPVCPGDEVCGCGSKEVVHQSLGSGFYCYDCAVEVGI